MFSVFTNISHTGLSDEGENECPSFTQDAQQTIAVAWCRREPARVTTEGRLMIIPVEAATTKFN